MEKQIDKTALTALLKRCEKNFGAGSVSFGTQGFQHVKRVSSGSINLDKILGGGWPEGRIFEIYGPESSGKTSIALLTVAAMQKQGKMCAYIDVEQALDPTWMAKLGVDIDNIILSQPTSGEEALQITETLASSNLVSFIVVDSVAALTPQAELDGEMTDASVGLQARLMSKAMRKLVGVLNKQDCSILFINQLREKIGIMFGNPETTTGGKALKFYASIRLDVRKEQIKEGADIVGQKIKIKTVKNKTFPPFRSTEVVLNYKNGFNVDAEYFANAVEMDIVKKSGSWYSYKDEKLGQGEPIARANLMKHPDYEAIKEEVRNRLNNQVVDGSPSNDEDEDIDELDM